VILRKVDTENIVVLCQSALFVGYRILNDFTTKGLSRVSSAPLSTRLIITPVFSPLSVYLLLKAYKASVLREGVGYTTGLGVIMRMLKHSGKCMYHLALTLFAF
jgi:hypothetical protein